MLKKDEIFDGNMKDDKFKLKNLTDALIIINYEQKNGMKIPENDDLREGFINPYIATYNSLKIRLLKTQTINQEEFEKSLYSYLHEDEELLKEAIHLASSRITNYKEENVYISNEDELSI